MQADISYIYVVVAIIWFVIKVIGKGSKKNTPHAPIPGNFDDVLNQPTGEESGKRPSFEDLLKEFTQEYEEPAEPEPKDVYVEDKHAPMVYEPMVHETTYTPVPVVDYDDTPISITKEGVPTLQELQFENYHIEEEDNHLAEEVSAMLKSPEGIRQAILVNEILNPKYF